MGSRVKVFVRLRPLLKREGDEEIPDCCARKITDRKLQLWSHRNPHGDTLEYEFDSVFDSETPQNRIYESVKSIIPNVLNGQNATIFGYGPTGAGKTHTIVGTKKQPGLIPRCINYTFKLLNSIKMKSQSEQFSVYFSMLEIYQEKVYDLIVQKQKDLQIRQDGNGSIFIPDLAEVEVNTFNDFITKYQSASNNRTIGSTSLNAHSSRSHTILLVKVVKTDVNCPSQKFVGKLYLIDLAGSEDNRKTGNTGIRLKESGAINSSLFSLSMVVDALNKSLHRIPYRDSKLTRLLQDSLGGTAHSVMIACIAPEPSFYWDTLNTLKFASKSRQVVNKPFTKVIHERALKRPNDNDDEAPSSKKHSGHNTKKIKESEKENQDAIIDSVKNLIGPIGRRQEELENKFENRLQMLESLLGKTQATSGGNRFPLSENTKENIPVGRVRPLMKKSRPAFCQTPSANEVINLGTPPSDGNSLEKTETAISLPNLIENGGRTPKYEITLDPKMHEQCEIKVMNILNNGTIKDIMTLPTIGKKRAELLMAYRIENGGFSSISDLFKVGYSKTMVNNFKKKYILERLVIS